MNKTCSSCKYASIDELGDMICVCGESDGCADYVTADDYCGCWEERGVMRNYIGYIEIESMTEPAIFEFEVEENLTEKEIEKQAYEALWESGIISWWYKEDGGE